MCIVVEEPIYIKAIRYKKIDTENPKPATWYERKLIGWTAPISNLRGHRLAEKRHWADQNQKDIKVRVR